MPGPQIVDGLVVVTDLYRNHGGCWLCGSREQTSENGRLIFFDGEPVGTYRRGKPRVQPNAGLLHERCARTVLHCLKQAERFLAVLAAESTAASS